EQRRDHTGPPVDPPARQELENHEEQQGAEEQRPERRGDAAARGRERVRQEQRPRYEHHGEIGQLGDRPGSVLLGVEHLVQCRAQAPEHTGREPQEQGRGEEREVAAPRDQVAEGALDEAELPVLPPARLGEKALQQLVDVELMNGELILREVTDDGQDEPDEGNGREQNVERQGTGEERNVVFVGGLEGTADDAGDRAVPAAFTIHASGSSSSSDTGGTGGLVARARRRRAASSRRRSCSRVAISGSSSSSSWSASSDSASSSASFRRPRTSSTFSAASSFKLRRPLVIFLRVLSAPSVGANTNPATAPSTMPKRNAPKPPPPPLRSLIRRPPHHPVPTRARPAAPRVTRVSVGRTDRSLPACPSPAAARTGTRMSSRDRRQWRPARRRAGPRTAA